MRFIDKIKWGIGVLLAIHVFAIIQIVTIQFDRKSMCRSYTNTVDFWLIGHEKTKHKIQREIKFRLSKTEEREMRDMITMDTLFYLTNIATAKIGDSNTPADSIVSVLANLGQQIEGVVIQKDLIAMSFVLPDSFPLFTEGYEKHKYISAPLLRTYAKEAIAMQEKRFFIYHGQAKEIICCYFEIFQSTPRLRLLLGQQFESEIFLGSQCPIQKNIKMVLTDSHGQHEMEDQSYAYYSTPVKRGNHTYRIQLQQYVPEVDSIFTIEKVVQYFVK